MTPSDPARLSEKDTASADAPADFISSRKHFLMCVGSSSPHFWRMAASASGDGVHTAAALTRVSVCGDGFAACCAADDENAAHSIASRSPVRIMSPSRKKQCCSASPYARFIQKVKWDFVWRVAMNAASAPVPEKMGRVCCAPHPIFTPLHAGVLPATRYGPGTHI